MAESAPITTMVEIRARDLATAELKKVQQEMLKVGVAGTTAGAAGAKGFKGLLAEVKGVAREIKAYIGLFGLLALFNRFIAPVISDWQKTAAETKAAREQFDLYLLMTQGTRGESQGILKTLREDLVKTAKLTQEQATAIVTLGDRAGRSTEEIGILAGLVKEYVRAFGGSEVDAFNELLKAQAGHYESIQEKSGLAVESTGRFVDLLRNLQAGKAARELKEVDEQIVKLNANLADAERLRGGIAARRGIFGGGDTAGLKREIDLLKTRREVLSSQSQSGVGIPPRSPFAKDDAARDEAFRKKQQADEKEIARLLRDHEKEVRDLAAAEKEWQEIYRSGRGQAADQFAQAKADIRESLTEMTSVYRMTLDTADALLGMADAAGAAFGAYAEGAKEGDEALKQFVRGAVVELTKLAMKWALVAFFKSLAGAGSGSGKEFDSTLYGGNYSGGNFMSGGAGFIGGRAKGGVNPQMHSFGPLGGDRPVRRFAMGGIAREPMVGIFGEGPTPEAFVPLPDGKNIPVVMKSDRGGGGGSVTNNYYINAIDTRSFQEALVAQQPLLTKLHGDGQQRSIAARRATGNQGRLI